MKFEFEVSPLVQEKKKYATFTVREIGGPEEIVKWRQQQEAKESIYRLRLGERNTRIETFEKETGQILDQPTLGKTPWAEKLAFAKSEQARLAKAEENVTKYPPWEPPTAPKQTPLQKIGSFLKRLWTNANF